MAIFNSYVCLSDCKSMVHPPSNIRLRLGWGAQFHKAPFLKWQLPPRQGSLNCSIFDDFILQSSYSPWRSNQITQPFVTAQWSLKDPTWAPEQSCSNAQDVGYGLTSRHQMVWIWGVPYIGISPNGWFLMENHGKSHYKVDDLWYLWFPDINDS